MGSATSKIDASEQDVHYWEPTVVDSVDLKFFLAVAATGGIGRAAKELKTVPSNVTQRIQALERELNVELFHRSRKGVVLTAVGNRLLPYAEQIKHTLREARNTVQERGMPTGELRIGSMETTVALHLSPLLARYAATYPDIDIQINTGGITTLLDGVLGRQLDGAFVPDPIKRIDLISVPIIREELVLITPPTVRSLRELSKIIHERKLKAIVFHPDCFYRQRLSEFLFHRGHADLRWMTMGMLDGIIGCVASSIGLSLLPRSAARAAERQGLVRIHALPNTIGRMTTAFVTRKDAQRSSALRAFIESAQTEYSSPTGIKARATPQPEALERPRRSRTQ